MKLKVAIITPHRVAELGAGDWVQAHSTFKAMQAIGVDVKHFILQQEKNENLSDTNEFVIRPEELPINVDVLHFISTNTVPSKLIYKFKSQINRPLLAASLVFWDSLNHRRIIMQNTGKYSEIIKYYVTYAFPSVSNKWKQLEHYDLIFTNSVIENIKCNKHFKIGKGATVTNVPNAINQTYDWVETCKPPRFLEENDYIVYPGVFSPRKNQLGFIKAMKNTDHKVVFMGGPLPNNESKKYYEKCVAEATPAFYFLGPIKHQSPEFYGILRNAKVACLASSCETPGIALLEAVNLGVRPAITREGSTTEYFGSVAEYFNPTKNHEIRDAIDRAWRRGHIQRGSKEEIKIYKWEDTAYCILKNYEKLLKHKRL